jgi:hypothetical protein
MGISEHLNAAAKPTNLVALLCQPDGGRFLPVGRLVFVAKKKFPPLMSRSVLRFTRRQPSAWASWKVA